jgi:hypothetical protein
MEQDQRPPGGRSHARDGKRERVRLEHEEAELMRKRGAKAEEVVAVRTYREYEPRRQYRLWTKRR